MSQIPDKIRVAVLYGGRSGEHEVSLVSASHVIQHLDRTLFEVVPVGIDKKGGWFLGDDVFKKELTPPVASLRLQCESERMLFHPDFIGKPMAASQLLAQTNHDKRIFDVIFPVIHGPLCEDGTVQGLLELTDIPYVGCGVLASAIGMDKDISKRLIQQAGLSVPPFISIKLGDWYRSSAACCDKINNQLQYPLFVKPANTGSSVGVVKVKQPKQLTEAIQQAFRYDVKVIIEQGINAREIEVAVLESLDPGVDPIVSVPGEIVPSRAHEFYTYASKYLDEKGAKLIIPAVISEKLTQEVRRMAKEVFLALECEGMARIDLFLEKDTDRLYFNEVNTIPGFTAISMYPKLMAASGMNYTKLLTHLLMLAIQRQDRKSKLAREYGTATV